jgi:hypothetical protein
MDGQIANNPRALCTGAAEFSSVAGQMTALLGGQDWLSRDEFGTDPLGAVVGEFHVRWFGPVLDQLHQRAGQLDEHADRLDEMARTDVSTEANNAAAAKSVDPRRDS